ncbi:hypothetical protein SAMN05414139_10870 [Burkholderia sp. D7]|nr:hypothetical protein SAMN05414139_10870 [Burkholderia sp. D7]
MFENIRETIEGWINRDAEQYILAEIPKERTDLTGADTPLTPMRDYVRIWLDDMFLAKDKEWFVERFPAVHTTIELKFGGNPVKVTHVTDGTGQVGRGIFTSYALTDLMPFNGGTVKVQSALLSLKGKDYASEAIGILKNFSSLVGAPLSQALLIADKVNAGMQSLLQKGDAGLVLGFHRQYAADGGGGGAVLKPGYTALILASRRDIDPDILSVKGGKLLYARKNGAPEPVEGFDYMLFRVEGRPERDNWRMSNIEEPLNQAIQATIRGDQQNADGYLKTALLVIWQSPDLSVHDRRRVADAIKAELAAVAETGHGAVPGELASLSQIMDARAMSVKKAMLEPALTLQEILAE